MSSGFPPKTYSQPTGQKKLRRALQKLAVLRRPGPESYQNSQDYFNHSTSLAQTLDRFMY